MMLLVICGVLEYVLIFCNVFVLEIIFIFASLTSCFPFYADNLAVQYRKIVSGIYLWPANPIISEAGKIRNSL